MREHPAGVSAEGQRAAHASTQLRDQIAAPARTILLVLLAAAAVVFVIACSNVANLILARSVRREGELAVRAALGAGRGALRRTLLAESLVLCGAGAALGVLLARPLVAIVARYAARFSVRALDVTRRSERALGRRRAGDGRGGAARVRPAPAVAARAGRSRPGDGSVRITPGTNRRLRVFATTQIAFSFVLLAGAGMLLATLVALQTRQHRLRHAARARVRRAAHRRPASAAPKVDRLLSGSDARASRAARRRGRRGRQLRAVARRRHLGPGIQFAVEGYTPADGEENPRARLRVVAPRFLLGARHPAARRPRLHRRGPRPATSRSSIVSQSLAQRLFPNGEALNRHLSWTDPLSRQAGAAPHRRRRRGRRRREPRPGDRR